MRGTVVLARAAAVVLVTCLAGCTRGAAAGPGPAAPTPAAGPVPATATATVERRDLVQRETLPGTLGYGPRRAVVGQRSGTLTRLAPAGTVIERGGALWDVDTRAVVVLYGPTPAFRALEPGVVGPDVRQLEENLVALGHATAGSGLPDDRFDRTTGRAVRAWQRALGWKATGRVEQGDVVFLPGAARAATARADLGQPLAGGEPVMEVTGAAREVLLRVTATMADLVEAGAAVLLRFPDGTETPGTVREVGRVATAPEPAPGEEREDPELDVTVAIDDPAAAPALDGAPVEVEATARSVEGALAVPVHALLALPGDAVAVERLRGGVRAQVDVEVGMFAEGWVQVTGDVREGDQVVVAS